jgi:hypothetical protein
MSTPSLLWIEPDPHSRDALMRFMASQKELSSRTHPVFVSGLQKALEAYPEGSYEAIVVEPLLLLQATTTVQNAFNGLPLIFYTQAPPVDFMPMARRYSVHRVMVKHLPFQPQYLYTQLTRCLNQETPEHHEEPVLRLTIQRGDDMVNALSRLESSLENLLSPEARMEMCTPLVEAITNAVYHAPRSATGESKYYKGQTIERLEAGEEVSVVLYATDREVRIQVRDSQGSLRPQQVLQGIAKNYFEEGLYDESGRGFFLMYCLMDEFHLHIVPGYLSDLQLVKYRHPPEASESTLPAMEDTRVKPLIITIGDPLSVAL